MIQTKAVMTPGEALAKALIILCWTHYAKGRLAAPCWWSVRDIYVPAANLEPLPGMAAGPLRMWKAIWTPGTNGGFASRTSECDVTPRPPRGVSACCLALMAREGSRPQTTNGVVSLTVPRDTTRGSRPARHAA